MTEISGKINQSVADYYSGKIREFGTTSKGVDWNGEDGQFLRFAQLAKLFPESGSFSVNDIGCGFGAMCGWIEKYWSEVDYMGCDLSPEMIEAAAKKFGNDRFVEGPSTRRVADFSVASGIFNVKLDVPNGEWEKFIYTCIDAMDAGSSKGFSFNCLTSYSDAEYCREDLHYADPCQIFDYCKKKFSRNVALLHDYDLYEFTILVRKELD